MSFIQFGIDLVERGWVPDFLTRPAIRRLCAERVRLVERWDCTRRQEELERFIELMRSGPVAPLPEKANEQHYELPPEFFAKVLGPHRKYSCCDWEENVRNLEQAEERALRITCERAQLRDGQNVLELGCGWGSLSLWIAARYPHSRVTAVSNSSLQKSAIEQLAAARGIDNLQVVTADMNDFRPSGLFDRILSVEMFEHMRNHAELLRRISTWLNPEGLLFLHFFCHKDSPYVFETSGDADWMGKYFFTGGIMPSRDLPSRFQDHLLLVRQWNWNGEHYRKTSDAWLANLDARRSEILPILAQVYGPREARRWFVRWRLFFLAVSELFGYRQGNEWWVTHVLFQQHPANHPGRTQEKIQFEEPALSTLIPSSH